MNRMDYMLRVRMSPAEQDRLQQLADLADCTISELVRRLVKDARVIVRPSLVEVENEPKNQELVHA